MNTPISNFVFRYIPQVFNFKIFFKNLNIGHPEVCQKSILEEKSQKYTLKKIVQ